MTQPALIRRFFALVWRDSPGYLGLIVVFSFASAALLAVFPWLWQFLVDEVRTTGEPVRLNELAMWMALVGVGHALLYFVLQGSRSVMNAKIEWRARRFVYRHLIGLDDDFYRRWRAGDLVTRLYDDAGEKISWFLCSGVFRAFEASLIVLACLGVMASIDWQLTLWSVLPLPLLILGQARLQRALGQRYGEVQASISSINDELATTFGGIRIVQAARLQEIARRRFADQAEAQRKAEIRVAYAQMLVFQMYGYAAQFALVALLLAGGLRVLDGRITIGQYVSFEGFLMTLVWPMFDVGMFVSRYKQTGVALERLQEILDERPTEALGTAEMPDLVSLELVDASVVAPDGTALVSNVNLSVSPGSMLAVVGEVGSGKTSLIGLLAGARRLSEGRFVIGPVDACEIDPGTLYRQVGYVPQDPVILSLSLRDNILLGRDFSDLDVERALQVSRLAQDLGDLPDGLDTTVGERGVTLSGGQQQRVALARALVGSPRILLLDDATAALDADTEDAFWRELERVLPGVTAVVVTHRVATMQRAGRIAVLEGGYIVQQGEHGELMGQMGPYQRIYGRSQAKERAGVT